jgi:hypothetical protein
MLIDDKERLQGLGTYIDGKLKRYNLLFAVNGGAFAIGKLLVDKQGPVLGGLELRHLAIGAILFTLIMGVDIYLFAMMMKTEFLGKLVFNRPGKAVLIFLCLLPAAGWYLVALQ